MRRGSINSDIEDVAPRESERGGLLHETPVSKYQSAPQPAEVGSEDVGADVVEGSMRGKPELSTRRRAASVGVARTAGVDLGLAERAMLPGTARQNAKLVGQPLHAKLAKSGR